MQAYSTLLDTKQHKHVSRPPWQRGAYLHAAEGVADGTGRGRGHPEGLVLLESVGQQAVDGAVVIVRIRLQGLEREDRARVKDPISCFFRVNNFIWGYY
jgi:hypothetical protein